MLGEVEILAFVKFLLSHFFTLDSIRVWHHLFLPINSLNFRLDCRVHYYTVSVNTNNHY